MVYGDPMEGLELFSSTVIPTVGRPTLTRAVMSVLEQVFSRAEFEVIVVNDSGQPLPDADWRESSSVRVIDTQRRERSVARNSGAAMARGRFLHFLDDDDWLAPNALESLWLLAEESPAEWLYGTAQLTSRTNKPLIRLEPGLSGNCFVQAMAGEWIPLQASLVDTRTFFALGGFTPQLVGPEDNDLLRRFTLAGTVAGTPELVAHISWGQAGSTTPYERHAQSSRWAREKILGQPEAFARMKASSESRYWRGRMVRAYLTSVVWNLQHGRLCTAASRVLFGLLALAQTGSDLLSADFWRKLAKPHDSPAFRQASRLKASLTERITG